MIKCWSKKIVERPSFEDIVKYLLLVEDNSDNFEKFSAIYHQYDEMDKKQSENSSKNSSIISETLDSKDITIINGSTSTEN